MRFPALIIALLCLLLAPPAQATPHDILAAGGAGGWLNVMRPLTAADMKGRVVLLDFWTYGCINCMQVVPDLSYLEEKFGDKLLIISVHSAKFTGEQGNNRIVAAAKRFGLKHPVINDSDFAIWKSFGVKAWPTFVVLDTEGKESARFSGEGHRADLESAISQIMPASATPLAGLVTQDTHKDILSFPARLSHASQSPWGDVVFIADSGHNRIVAVDPQGGIKAVIGSGQAALKDGNFSESSFRNPRGLIVSGNNIYVADTGNHAIRRIDLTTKNVVTLAGNGSKTDIASPWDVEMMGDNKTLAIAMAGRHQLWTYDTETGKLDLLAGTRAENITDGPALEATLAQPSALSRSGDTLFFVDAESSALRMLSSGEIKTLIGTGLFDFGDKDGIYPEARLQHPEGLYADQDGILIADTYNNSIRAYERKTGTLSTLKLAGDILNEPGDILPVGNDLWVVDTGNHMIKKVNLNSGAVSVLTLTPVTP